MSTVKNSYLDFFVGFGIICPYNIEACLFKGKLIFKVTLNNPQMENLRCVEEFIVGGCVFQLIARVSRYDAVYKRVRKNVLGFNPTCKSAVELPVFGIFNNAVSECIAVAVNQLAGQDDKAAESVFVSSVKQLSQLAGE